MSYSKLTSDLRLNTLILNLTSVRAGLTSI